MISKNMSDNEARQMIAEHTQLSDIILRDRSVILMPYGHYETPF
jgi:hypothetical protein